MKDYFKPPAPPPAPQLVAHFKDLEWRTNRLSELLKNPEIKVAGWRKAVLDAMKSIAECADKESEK